jgi:hypothetical protein
VSEAETFDPQAETVTASLDAQATPREPVATPTAPTGEVLAPGSGQGDEIDLDAVARDLADVEIALARLDAGTYWTDEVTGAPLSDEHMIAEPTARRAAEA